MCTNKATNHANEARNDNVLRGQWHATTSKSGSALPNRLFTRFVFLLPLVFQGNYLAISCHIRWTNRLNPKLQSFCSLIFARHKMGYLLLLVLCLHSRLNQPLWSLPSLLQFLVGCQNRQRLNDSMTHKCDAEGYYCFGSNDF